MLWGTSKIWSKSGPADLPIITNMFQRIQENCGIILKTYVHIWEYGNIIFSKSMKGMPTFFWFVVENICFEIEFWKTFRYLQFRVYFQKTFFWYEDRKWYIFHKNISKCLDMNFISIKNHEMQMWSFLFSGRGIPKLFLFSRKGNIQY